MEGREGEGERDQFAIPFIYAFIAWFLCAPWPGIESATLEYQDDTLANWAPWPVLICIYLW